MENKTLLCPTNERKPAKQAKAASFGDFRTAQMYSHEHKLFFKISWMQGSKVEARVSQ